MTFVPDVSKSLATHTTRNDPTAQTFIMDAARPAGAVHDGQSPALKADTYAVPIASNDAIGVRRLTPLECERLMGWPDGWTSMSDTGEPIADTHRYHMTGNGVVAPVAEWIMRRIITAYTRTS